MLRMNMTQAEKDLVAVHKRALEIYPMWKCNCCRQNFLKGVGSPIIDVFRPPKGMRFVTKECASTFLICEDCQRLPDAEITKGVIAGYLQEKVLVFA